MSSRIVIEAKCQGVSKGSPSSSMSLISGITRSAPLAMRLPSALGLRRLLRIRAGGVNEACPRKLNSVLPDAWIPAAVEDGKNLDMPRHHSVVHDVRKPAQFPAADALEHYGVYFRHRLDAHDKIVKRAHKNVAKAGALAF